MPQFEPPVRKRKADDTELELTSKNSGQEEHREIVGLSGQRGVCAAKAVPAVIAQRLGLATLRAQCPCRNIRVVDGPRRPRLSSKALRKYSRNSVRTMGNSLKGFLSNVGARISRTAYEAVETRKHDESRSHVDVKCFKRQFCIPGSSLSEECDTALTPFDRLPYFEWENDAT
jgi:hypothetical protein